MDGLGILATAIAFLIAIVVHESAHALVADRLGDPTARALGRVSFNPLRHIDPIGTVLLPALMLLSGTGMVFGWAKPVPVNIYNFRNPVRGRLLTALAGPLSNLLTATVFALAARLLPSGTNLPSLFGTIVIINLVLMMFNLLPVPPLDGATILPYLLGGRDDIVAFLERQGFMLLLGLLVLDAVSGGRIFLYLVRLPVAVIGGALLGAPS